MKYQDLKSNLKNNVGSLYLLFGEDSFLIENSLRLIKEFLNISMPEINIANYVEGDIDGFKIVRFNPTAKDIIPTEGGWPEELNAHIWNQTGNIAAANVGSKSSTNDRRRNEKKKRERN